ncbi:MAG: glycolate oxidase iron-sulfur subunit [Gammaproteobacteria bacterium]|jgi:glycolate oxidase iron-sulfur subunit|nr:glycolate oxidase iron-sulfur subunit [Gammaproteobacteria bacterium]NCW09248.1 glycolate oxidase iron-sulfur subunit [Gammaproteobacteria bacterium]
MQTNIVERYANTDYGREAEAILRKCVHCGFCTATCPTYQLLGDELDGPRGRIYQIKEILEGATPTASTQTHLDRCLTCRSCETTCPSGVDYGRLADIGRKIVEDEVGRSWIQTLIRKALIVVIPNRQLFGFLMRMGQLFRPLMPGAIRRKIPQRVTPSVWPTSTHVRTMVVLEACAQPSATPNVNAAAARVLDRLGIQLIAAKEAGCCGAVAHHLSDHDRSYDAVKRNIDAWWPLIEQGAEAIVITASGCGVMVKEYGHLLADDPLYAEKAQRVSELAKDISEVLVKEDLGGLKVRGAKTLAFHSPCTLQHGQKLNGLTERVLRELGFDLKPVADSHLCCGSAGTYSILQPDLSKRLLKNKVKALEATGAPTIATANVGCQLHLSTGANTPVKHWIELVDEVTG